MGLEIKRIALKGVNCYLIKNEHGFFLIDTGYATARQDLDEALQRAGCDADNLKLILLTHGDIDHTGNCAYLSEKYNARIAMHPADKALVEEGKQPDREIRSGLLKIILKIDALINGDKLFKTFEKFTPHILLDDGFDFTEFGLDVRVVHIPGHTMGSVGFLTADDDLFSGDTLMNANIKRMLSGWAENFDALRDSMNRLLKLDIRMIYPGHMKAFPMAEVREKNQ